MDLAFGLKEAFDDYICRNEGLWVGFWAELERAIDELDEGQELTIKLRFKHCGDKIVIFPSEMRPLRVNEEPVAITWDGKVELFSKMQCPSRHQT